MDFIIFIIKSGLMITGLAVWVMILAVLGGFMVSRIKAWWSEANGI